MSVRVVIIGAGGHGAELRSYVADLQMAGQSIHLLGFVDDSMPNGGSIGDTPVWGDVSSLTRIVEAQGGDLVRYIIAVGDNPARKALVDRIDALGLPNLRPWTLQHPEASVGLDVEIGEGTLLAPGVVVTTRARIGSHCILNVKASVSHDCQIEDFVNINPAATIAGNVFVDRGAYVGAGATIIQKRWIGAWSVIGAGAAVVRDIPERVTAVGVPARVLAKDQ
jgi:acetyltransferase EpsM